MLLPASVDIYFEKNVDLYCPISINISIQYYFSIRLHQKFLGKGGKKKKKKKEIWMFSKSLDLDGNKITNSIHWYAPKKQNELPNMEDALISNFHTHKQTAYNTTYLTLLLPIFNSNFYKFLLPMYTICKKLHQIIFSKF